MKKEDMTPEEKKIQKVLNKLMSEEYVAHMFYLGCIAAACKCQGQIIHDMFKEIAEDELNDHFMHMKVWANENDFSTPYKFKDFMKYAEADCKRLDNLKNHEEALYYVDLAIESEQAAIASYNEAMQDDVIPYDLNTIFMQNYYDECEHLENLSVLKYALEAGAELSEY